MPFDDKTRFIDFCDLIENLVLADQINVWNIGAYTLEWENGFYMLPHQRPSIHPYEVFSVLGCISCAPMSFVTPGFKIIEQLPENQTKEKFHDHFGKLHFEFTLSVALSMYVQAYNGELGNVSVREPAIIEDILPDLIVYCDGKKVTRKGPLILQAIERLNNSFGEEISKIDNFNFSNVVIPPVAAVLLNRLPDDCQDPYTVIREIFELREEMTLVRRRFSDLEEIAYDPSASLKEIMDIKKAVETDSERFHKTVSDFMPNSGRIRWYIDKLSLVCNLLMHQGIPLDELVHFLLDIIPTIERRVKVQAPSRMLWLALDAHKMRGYQNLAKRKLGMNL